MVDTLMKEAPRWDHSKIKMVIIAIAVGWEPMLLKERLVLEVIWLDPVGHSCWFYSNSDLYDSYACVCLGFLYPWTRNRNEDMSPLEAVRSVFAACDGSILLYSWMFFHKRHKAHEKPGQDGSSACACSSCLCLWTQNCTQDKPRLESVLNAAVSCVDLVHLYSWRFFHTCHRARGVVVLHGSYAHACSGCRYLWTRNHTQDRLQLKSVLRNAFASFGFAVHQDDFISSDLTFSHTSKTECFKSRLSLKYTIKWMQRRSKQIPSLNG